tara:strand:- start:24 stop:623 length:600 start_codon:yes stop_codon:yes gene_type:complete
MTNKLEQFLEKQINSGNINWESKSKLIRTSGEKINGNTAKIVKKFENRFNFGLLIDQKNKAIKKYFNKFSKNSFISVTAAVKGINEYLPKNNKIGGTSIIYNRLNDSNFNTNNLKGQSLDNQVSKTKLYQVSISKEFEEKVNKLNSKGFYVYIEDTQAGNKTIRLEIPKLKESKSKRLVKYFSPNEESLKKIQELINER